MGEKTKILIQNFHFSYREFPALREVNLSIRANQIFTVLGPARSGKTTFLKSLNRLTDLIFGTSHTGNIYIDSQEIHAPEVSLPDLRRRVGMVFDLPTPLPLSIFDNVAYGHPSFGRRSKTGCPHRPSAYQGDSSNGFALPGYLPWNRR
jgi:phosphate transport system ATP-binding protein